MAFNRLYKKSLGLFCLLLCGGCCLPNFPKYVDNKIEFLQALRKKEGKQKVSETAAFGHFGNVIYLRKFHDPLAIALDPVTTKLNYESSLMYYYFSKPDEYGIGKVWISDRFLEKDFQKYYRKGHGFDYYKFKTECINAYCKVYELDVNDNALVIYTDKLQSKGYQYACTDKIENEHTTVSTKNYFLSELMYHYMGSNKNELVKRFTKYSYNTDFTPGLEFTLEKLDSLQAPTYIVDELIRYETDPDYRLSDNVANYNWEQIRDLDRNEIEKLTGNSYATLFAKKKNTGKKLVAAITENEGWVYAGSCTPDKSTWVNQRFLLDVEKLDDYIKDGQKPADTTDPKAYPFHLYSRTYLRDAPPDTTVKDTITKGTIVNIIESDKSFRIKDKKWMPGLNTNRTVLWLKIEVPTEEPKEKKGIAKFRK